MKKPNEVVQLKLRFSERLRARLEKAASKNDDSLNTEIIRRLERSFSNEDIIAEALGGPELRHLTLSAAASFADGCKRAAEGLGQDDWTAKDWVKDQRCYRAGIVRVIMNMIEAMPDPSREEKELLLFSLQSRVGASLTRSNELKYDFNDGRGPVGTGFLEHKDDAK